MYVVLLAAQSLDGWITRQDEPGDAFTSAADKEHFRNTVRNCDACVMGSVTYGLSRARMRPAAFPALRRIVWTRRPEAYAAEAISGVLDFSAATPRQTYEYLQADGRQRCALLGGGRLNAAWLAASLVDEISLTVEPRLFGCGVPLVDVSALVGAGMDATPAPRLDTRLDLLETRALGPGGTLLLRYAVKR